MPQLGPYSRLMRQDSEKGKPVLRQQGWHRLQVSEAGRNVTSGRMKRRLFYETASQMYQEELSGEPSDLHTALKATP